MSNAKKLSYPDALDVLLDAIEPIDQQQVNVLDATGYILAETVTTPRAFPDTRRSAVDGYAFGALEPGRYKLTEVLGAENLPQQQVAEMTAAAVMTGATVPDGALAVERVENTELDGDYVVIKEALSDKQNINAIGEEAQAGEVFLEAGRPLGAIAQAVLCSLGLDQVVVYRKPRVGVMITGNELLRPGEPHQKGLVYECNSTLVKNTLEALGAEVTLVGPVADDPEALAQTLDELAASSDLVVTSGGVSMGKFDYVRPLLQRSGYELLVDKTRIKPGSPLIAAKKGNCLFFGMPGYPAAFLVNMFAYLVPVLKKLRGVADYRSPFRPVTLTAPLKGRTGRWDMIRVKLVYEGGQVLATPLKSQMTSHFLNMALCDGLVILDGDTEGMAAGETALVLDFSLSLALR